MKRITIPRAVMLDMSKTMTFKQIAEHFGVYKTTITRIAAEYRIHSIAELKRARKGEVERVFELASQGMSHRAIAKSIDRTESFVYYHLHRWDKPEDRTAPRNSVKLDKADRSAEKRLKGLVFEDAPQRLLDKECWGAPIIGARASAHFREVAISSSAELCADAG